MRYQIYNNGELVLVAKSLSEVSRHLRKSTYNAKGFSLTTLKQIFNKNTPEGTTFRKFGYEVVQGRDDSKDSQDLKDTIKYIEKSFVDKMKNGFYKKKIPLFSQRINFENKLLVRGEWISDIINKVMNTIKKVDSDPRIATSVYRVYLNVDHGEVSDYTYSTPYANYNVVIEDLTDTLITALGNYTDDMYINYIDIERIETPPKERAIVFGSMKDINAYQSISEGMIFSNSSKKIFCELSREYIFVKPKTNSQCILTACYMSLKETDDINNSDINDIVKRKIPKDTKHNLEEMCPIISKILERKINAYYLDYDIEKFVYNKSEKKTINIIVYQGHAIACIPKKDNDDLATRVANGSGNEQTLYEPAEIKTKDGYKIATFDLETCDSDMEIKDKHDTIPYACGYYDGKTYKEFFKNKYDNVLKAFLDYLKANLKNDIVLYAHNGGKFDTYLLLKEVLKRDDVTIINFLENGGRILELHLIINKKNVLIRDSFNLIASSLDQACEDFKPKTVKLEGDVDHSKININNCSTEATYDYVKQYLQNDCVSLHEILTIFDKILVESYNFGVRENITNASIARNFYKTKHYDQEKYPIHKLPDRIDEELRKYYFGGRNECMTSLGYIKKRLFYLDFTSLYPSVMQKYEYQYGEVEELDVNTKLFNSKWFGFVKCRFRHKNHKNIPLHAVVIDNKLCFPYCDEWQESIISTEEIRYSLKCRLGYEYEYIKVYNYSNKAQYFKNPVDELYKMKIDAQNNGNEALRSIAKIIINSLYGFFGIRYKDRDQTKIVKEKCGKTKTVDDNRENKLTGYLFAQKLKDYDHIGGYDVYKVVDSIKADFANVGIASMVTSYARMELYKLLRDIKIAGGNIYYMDTDSVVTDYNIYANKKLCEKWIGSGGKKLGELTNETKEEGGYYRELVTLGNKMYALKNSLLKKKPIVLKMKGLNIKMRFDKKTINHEKKTIKYTKPNKFTGKYKIDFEDFKLMAEGYDLIGDTMQFRSGVNDMIFKDKGLIKVENNKRIKGPTQIIEGVDDEGNEIKVKKTTYTKAEHDVETNKLSSLVIKHKTK